MRIKAASRRIGGLVAFAAVLGGCAFVDRHAPLVYPPPGDAIVAPAPDAGPVLVAVTDGRPGDLGRVGHVKNGFGMNTADVTITDDPIAWVKGALEHELQAQGVRVATTPDAAARLNARVVRIECDAYLTYDGHVDLTTDLEVAGRPVQSAVVAGEGGGSMNWTATERSYSEALAQALQDAARKVAGAVRSAVAPVRP